MQESVEQCPISSPAMTEEQAQRVDLIAEQCSPESFLADQLEEVQCQGMHYSTPVSIIDLDGVGGMMGLRQP
jgi:hypothetical protein